MLQVLRKQVAVDLIHLLCNLHVEIVHVVDGIQHLHVLIGYDGEIVGVRPMLCESQDAIRGSLWCRHFAKRMNLVVDHRSPLQVSGIHRLIPKQFNFLFLFVCVDSNVMIEMTMELYEAVVVLLRDLLVVFAVVAHDTWLAEVPMVLQAVVDCVIVLVILHWLYVDDIDVEALGQQSIQHLTRSWVLTLPSWLQQQFCTIGY